MPRRSAERRGRPQADVRGNAKHPWRSPHWPRTRMRSSEVPVRILPFAPFGAPPPLIFLEANAFVQWLAKTRAPKNASRERRSSYLVIASAAKQSRSQCTPPLDCFVASLLAMTRYDARHDQTPGRVHHGEPQKWNALRRGDVKLAAKSLAAPGGDDCRLYKTLWLQKAGLV